MDGAVEMLVKRVGRLEETRARARRAKDTEVGLVGVTPGIGADLVLISRRGVGIVVDVANEMLSLRVGGYASSVVSDNEMVDPSAIHSRAASSGLEVQSRVAEGAEHLRTVTTKVDRGAGDSSRSMEGGVAMLRRKNDGEEQQKRGGNRRR